MATVTFPTVARTAGRFRISKDRNIGKWAITCPHGQTFYQSTYRGALLVLAILRCKP
jgi:hypothetical protein